MGFATGVVERGGLPRSEVDRRQLKNPLRSVQQRIESPRAGDLIGLEFRDEQLELCGSMLPRFASTWADVGCKCPWIARITYADREWFRLRQSQGGKQNEAAPSSMAVRRSRIINPPLLRLNSFRPGSNPDFRFGYSELDTLVRLRATSQQPGHRRSQDVF